MEALGEGRESLDPLWAIEEGRRAGEDEVESWEPTGIKLIHELTKRVQRTLADVAAHSLHRLDLVEHKHKACMPRIAQNQKETLEEREGPHMVDLALHAGSALDGGGHGRFTTEPREQPVGRVALL